MALKSGTCRCVFWRGFFYEVALSRGCVERSRSALAGKKTAPTWTHLVDVHQVDAGERLDLVGDGGQQLVHAHARRVVVAPEADDDDAALLAQDGLVDGVGVVQVREQVAHCVYWLMLLLLLLLTLLMLSLLRLSPRSPDRTRF
jgi:hypothetical protein